MRMSALKTLKGNTFGVRDEFSKVIEARRKLLYPEMRRERENKRNNVRLVRDRLYILINNAKYVPRSTNNPGNTKDTYQQRHAGCRNQWYESQSYSMESSNSIRENRFRKNKGYNSRSRVYHRLSNQTYENGSEYR